MESDSLGGVLGEVTEEQCHSEKTWLPAKAKRTVTKSGAPSEPWSVVIKHLHRTMSKTKGNRQGTRFRALGLVKRGRTSLDVTEIKKNKYWTW